MSPLLFLTSLLLATSGALKARSKARTGLGFPWLPLTELLVSLALAALAFGGRLGQSVGFWVVTGSVALMVVSSVLHARATAAVRRRREASEGARLATYVRHLSGPKPGE